MIVGIDTEIGNNVDKFEVGDRLYAHLPIRETHTLSQEGRWGENPIWVGLRNSRINKVPDGLTLEQVVCLHPGHFALAAVRNRSNAHLQFIAILSLYGT